MWKTDIQNTNESSFIYSLDGSNVLSEACFVLSMTYGVKNYFDKWGLLEKIQDATGNEILYERSSGHKKITKILNSNAKSYN